VKKLKFVWVDDQKSKVEPYREALESGIQEPRTSATVELIEVKSDIIGTLESWTKKNQSTSADLLIIDHVFNPVLPFGLKGSSVAHLLRRLFPKTPMVCVTAMFSNPQAFDQEDLREYVTVIPYTGFAERLEDVYVIARDFGKLTPNGTGVREHLVSCLKPPQRDRSDLDRLLPEEFRNPSRATTEHRMARWVINILRSRPGFLYDRLHAATLLGLKENGFSKVEGTFSKALYRGVFATRADPRWWVSELTRIAFAEAKAEGADTPQLAGRSLPGIADGDYSVCYVSRKAVPAPDTVAYTDATEGSTPRVVRREFTAQHPHDPGTMGGFETRTVLAKKAR
jgi:hypothetical protein